MYRIIQASLPHTGSTLLLNLLLGFIAPHESYQWDTKNLIDSYLVTKTHNININKWTNKYKHYKLYFVMSERNDNKIHAVIPNKYKKKNNVLIINYNQINVTNKLLLDDVIENIFNLFINFFPYDLIPKKEHIIIKKDMKNRIISMNQCYEKIKNKPFTYCDSFFGIHGSHRNRNIYTNTYNKSSLK